MGIDPKLAAESLKGFKNAERRFEIKFEDEKLIVIDDYGHHPSEIKATLTSAKNLGKKNVIAIFQPHLWSRTYFLYKDFALALNIADKIIVTEVYGAREDPIDGFSSESIVKELVNLGRKGSDIFFARSKDEVLEIISNMVIDDAVLVLLGAGDINKIFKRVLEVTKK
jgi:UDP-N-acetylmuramate--alanine ligase